VSRVLSAEQVDEYRSWSDTDRRLRALVRELEQIAIAAVEADPRSPTAPRPACVPLTRLCKTRDCSALNLWDDVVLGPKPPAQGQM
jgi:hypothetical protein